MYQYQDFGSVLPMYMIGMPQQYYPMIYMPKQHLEMMYPKVYHMINNAVGYHCDMMEMQCGPMHTPSKEEIDEMADKIYNQIGPQVEEMEEYKEELQEERQLGFGGRRLFRDLITIFLIRELLRRRREHSMYGGFEY